VRSLGLLLIACAMAHADTAVDPMPAEVRPSADKPADPPKLDPKDMKTLTADPVLGKADKVDGDETSGVVAFTFDDGPNPATTPAVIDALEKYNIPATFFIVTQRINGKLGAKSRDVLARELAEGFTVGSHSVTHPNLGKGDSKLFDKEIDPSVRTLAITANRPIGLFRPPYGSMNKGGRARLKSLGLTEVQWSVDTLDWRARDAARLRKKVVSMIVKQHGGVVLMHDVKPITAKVLPQVLDDLEAENCRRLAAKEEPIVPVSLHYFLRDKKTARAIPDDVKARTEAYKLALPARCATRPQPEPTDTHEASSKSDKKPG
jgi:peptidoglycan/xylan/chitin deacetylase (PgdA/CDA1 family)